MSLNCFRLAYLQGTAIRFGWITVGIIVIFAIGTAWLWTVGISIESSTFTRVFQPLITACLMATLLESPLGELQRTLPLRTNMTCFALYVAIAVEFCVLTVFQTGFSEISMLTIRNLAAYFGVASLLSFLIAPRHVWVVIVPLWATVFVFEASRYPEIWPNILWAWPMGVLSDRRAMIFAIALGVFGVIRILTVPIGQSRPVFE